MRSLLVNNGAAHKLRSLFALLFMLGIINTASAVNNYWVVGTVNLAGTTFSYTTAQITGASSSGTTITCASTAGLYVNEVLNTTLVSGSGTIASGTYIQSINANGTQFTVNNAPTSLSGATITVSSALYTNVGLTTFTTTTTEVTSDVFNLTTATSVLTTQTTASTLGAVALTAGTYNASVGTTSAATTISGDLTIGSGGTVNINSGTALFVSGNIVMTGGTLAIGTGVIRMFKNLAGNTTATAQASGTITGSGTFVFAATSILGSGNSVNATTGAITLGTSPNPQKINANFSSSSSTTNFQIYTYLQVAGTTILPANSRMKNGNGGTATSLLDLNGNSFSLGCYTTATSGAGTLYDLIRGGGNSSLEIRGSSLSLGSGLVMDQSTPGTTNAINLIMTNNVTPVSNASIINSLVLLNSGSYPSALTNGYVFLNGQNVTAATTFPTASATSYFQEGSTVSSAATGGTMTINAPSTTSTPTVIPLGTYNAAQVYTPVSFANTTGSPTSFTVSVATLTAGNVFGNGSGTNGTLPYQWNITTTGGTNPTAQIAFQSPAANSGFTTTGGATAQLGVLVNGTTGYANVVTTSTATPALLTSMTISGSGPYVATTPSGYVLYSNSLSNTYVIGNTGAVFPLPTLTNSTLTATATLNAVYTSSSPIYSITGTNITTLSAATTSSGGGSTGVTSGLPTGVTITKSSTTAGYLAGTPSDASGSTYSVVITATNIAATTTETVALSIGSNPTINSALTATALVGGTFNYTITASGAANQFTANIPSTNSLSSSLSLSGAVISGTLAAGTAGQYSIPLTATNTSTGLSCTSCPTLILTVLDAPTVSGISPSTGAVDGTSFALTATGTNFVSGYSTIKWAGSSTGVTSVSVIDASHISATIDLSLIAHTVSSNTPAVTVTNSGTNSQATTTPATPASVSSTSSPTTYTISVATPTVTSLSPAATVAGALSAVVTVTGTNFISGVSAVTLAGSTTGVTTTYVSNTQLTATISSSVLGSAGTPKIGVTNTGAGTSASSLTASNPTFTIYSGGAAWALTTDGTAVQASNLTAVTLVTGTGSTNIVPNSTSAYAAITATGLNYTPSVAAASQSWPADGPTGTGPTVNNTTGNVFNGVTTTASVNNIRYIEFAVTPNSGNNFTVNNITIPITNHTTTGSLSYAVAYSLDGFNTTSGVTSISPVGGTAISTTAGLTSVNFNYTTPFIVQDGKTLSVRVIFWINKNAAQANSYITLSNVVIAGTVTAAYPSPNITSALGTVSGDQSVTYTTGSPLYTFTASNPPGATGHTITYSASPSTFGGYTFNTTDGTVSGKSTTSAGGNYSVTLTADNGNLFPTSTTVTFAIDGIPFDPTTTSISPTTAVVDGAGFTITVNGTNFVNGKTSVTWNGTTLATTIVSGTQATATVPASLLLGSSISSATANVGVTSTGANTPNSNTQTFTITNITPVLNAISPAGIVAGGSGFTLSVYGSNFTTASKITWNGTQYTTTFVSTTLLTAAINASDITSTGTVTAGATNVFPGAGSLSTATTQSFIIGNATATWTTASLTPSLAGNISATTPTLTGMVTGTASGSIIYSQGAAGSFPADGSTSTPNSTFTGLAASTATTTTTTSVRSVDFIVSPSSLKDMTISAVSVPVYASGSGAMVYTLAYSTDVTNFTKISTATNTGNSAGAVTVFNTNDISIGNGSTMVTNYVFPTPISIANGNSLTFRVILWRRSSSTGTATVNIGSLTVVGNITSVAKATAPSITSLSDDNQQVDVYFSEPSYNGTSPITSYTLYAYASGSSTPTATYPVTLGTGTLATTPYHILATSLTNNISYTFKVSATNASGEGTLSASSIGVIPSNNTTWTVTGGVGSWDHGDPDAGNQNATINGNITLTKNFNCLKLTVASGVTVSVPSAYTFTVQGNLSNNGTITGTLLLNTTAAQTISGTGTVYNVTINNTSGGVSITSGSSNKFNVAGVLILKSGVVTTNSNLTFRSLSIANSGTLAPIDGVTNTGSISGNVTVERYIPAGYRGYRDLVPSVHNAGSIYNNWQEAGRLPGSTGYQAGYGIFITGPSATHANDGTFYGSSATSPQPAPNSFGLDYSINGSASAFAYNNSNASFYSLYAANKIDSIYNTTTINLYPFTGYRVLIRGDRSFNLANTAISNIYNFGLLMYNPTILRATGQLITGTVTYTTSGVSTPITTAYESISYGLNASPYKFSMVANPYVAPVLWGDGTNTTGTNATTVYGASGGTNAHINASYWYMDPTYSATGKDIAYNAITGSNAVVNSALGSNTYSGTTAAGNGYIQAGQAIFVQNAASGSPTVVFTEKTKAVNSTKTAVFGVSTPLSKIYISLLKKDTTSNYNRVDGAAIAFRSDFANATYGPQDALKFGTSTDNLFIADKGKNLSIDGRAPATSSDVIALGISSVSSSSYQLDIDATNYTSNGFAPYLVDSYRGTTTALTAGANSIKFTADAKVAASFDNRFSIAFKPTTLAVNSIVASASLNNKVATISWNTVGEKGVSRFEVEKSTDAVSFSKIGQTSAKNTSTASYSTIDNSATAATNYYRIKAISEVGTVTYSNVAKVSITNYQLPITVYPNPLKGSNVVNVSFNNIAAGKYSVTITNVLGQKVQEAAINHSGGNAIHAIKIGNTIASGNYTVAIRETGSGLLVHQLGLCVQP